MGRVPSGQDPELLGWATPVWLSSLHWMGRVESSSCGRRWSVVSPPALTTRAMDIEVQIRGIEAHPGLTTSRDRVSTLKRCSRLKLVWSPHGDTAWRLGCQQLYSPLSLSSTHSGKLETATYTI